MPAAAVAPSDRDLTSIQEARRLAQRAKQAAAPLAELNQDQIDRIVDALAAARAQQNTRTVRIYAEFANDGPNIGSWKLGVGG